MFYQAIWSLVIHKQCTLNCANDQATIRLMQDLSNQYLIEKREPQPASFSSRRAQAHWAAAACYVRTTWVRCRWFMRSGFQLWLLFVPNIIHAHTIFDVHHHLLLFFGGALTLFCSALNCWCSHSAHVSERKCNRLEIIIFFRIDVLRLRLLGVFTCHAMALLF